MPKVYLDMCSIQRPLDTMRQTCMRLEAEAVLGVTALCEADKVQLISSDVLELELEQNPLPIRREHAQRVLSWATEVIEVDETVEQRAAFFENLVTSQFVGVDPCVHRLWAGTETRPYPRKLRSYRI